MITSANIVSYDGYNLIVRPHERIGTKKSCLISTKSTV